MTTQISFDNVNKTFPGDVGSVKAIDDLSFEIQAGEFVGYAGPNGAGKSTSIKAMTGLLSVTSGEVRVRGVDPLRQRRQLARHIGVVFGQRSQMLWELSPLVYFEMVRALYKLSSQQWHARLDHLTSVLEMKGFIDQPVRTLSLGQRMRCELAAALLAQPEILFLDEPTIGLDIEAKAAMRDMLRTLNAEEGTTVVLTTHDLSDIEALCSRLMIIDHGRLAYDGRIDSLLTSYAPKATVEFHVDSSEPHLQLEPLWDVNVHRNVVRVSFDREQTNAASVIRDVITQIGVNDLVILEPNLEEVIGTIYRSSH